MILKDLWNDCCSCYNNKQVSKSTKSKPIKIDKKAESTKSKSKIKIEKKAESTKSKSKIKIEKKAESTKSKSKIKIEKKAENEMIPTQETKKSLKMAKESTPSKRKVGEFKEGVNSPSSSIKTLSSISSFSFFKDSYDEKLQNGLESCLKGDKIEKLNRNLLPQKRVLYLSKKYDILYWGRFKSQSNSNIHITEIKRVYRLYDTKLLKDRKIEGVFSVVTNKRILYFDCLKRSRRNKWVAILQWCIDNIKTKGALDLLLLREEWNVFDENNDGKLVFKEVKKLLESLNVKFDYDEIIGMMKDISNGDFLTFEQFVELKKKLVCRYEFIDLFENYSDSSSKMSIKVF
ncbi:1-phosphatidylinositol 4,5-bisphosphate phosphodiesterase delta-4 [Bonamia ostreae]|uniref:phosphoinositide phospholipase C n=1 Tax=Bonamia ostreae TaxID=126728 RepID=A0ABV2AFK3_9EUKA